MKKLFWLPLMVLLLVSCNTIKNPGKALHRMGFLEGEWKFSDQGVVVIEKWNRDNSGNMDGVSLLMVNGDTLFVENILVSEVAGQVLYKSTMGKYVKEDLKTLVMTRCTRSTVVFGNRNLLNSTYIYYKRSKDKVILEMRDTVDNTIEQDRYTLERIK
jgi:hypothetical protein